jgi:antitoxin (DNA-binding transcriptional repressor) of toxin-antitoxin stability system
MIIGMIVTEEIGTKLLADLIKQVQAGNEILLTQGNKPVAKIVAASEKTAVADAPFEIHSLKGRRVLTPNVSGAEIAEEMFGQK